MTKTLILFIIVSIFSIESIAQSDYAKYFNKGVLSFKQENYLSALEMFDLASEVAKTPKEKNESKNWRRKSKDGIKKQANDLLIASEIRKRAVEAEKMALEQKRLAIEMKKIAEVEKNRADEAKMIALKNSKIALEAIDAVYFYNDELALAKKNELFGFIDKRGNTKIDYKYENAGSFDQTGFAKVKREGKYYLIDITGTEYLLSLNPEDINQKTLAIDLRGWNLSKFPKQILKFPQIEIILLGDNKLIGLPKKIANLKKLKVLELRDNPISSTLIKETKNQLNNCLVLH